MHGQPTSSVGRCSALSARCRARWTACRRMSGTAATSHSTPRRAAPTAYMPRAPTPSASHQGAVGVHVHPQAERAGPEHPLDREAVDERVPARRADGGGAGAVHDQVVRRGVDLARSGRPSAGRWRAGRRRSRPSPAPSGAGRSPSRRPTCRVNCSLSSNGQRVPHVVGDRLDRLDQAAPVGALGAAAADLGAARRAASGRRRRRRARSRAPRARGAAAAARAATWR